MTDEVEDTELGGEELICSNRDAALSSSGVQVGDAEGDLGETYDAVPRSRRRGLMMDMPWLCEPEAPMTSVSVVMGRAGPGREREGRDCVPIPEAALIVPERGGDGR